jgi:hypothetical protein
MFSFGFVVQQSMSWMVRVVWCVSVDHYVWRRGEIAIFRNEFQMIRYMLPLIQFGAGYSPPQKTKNVQHLSSQILLWTEM